RSRVRVSSMAWAATILGSGAAPGAGAKTGVSATPGVMRSPPSWTQFLPGQLEEHVLQRAALDPQAVGQHAALRAPRGHRGQQQRVNGAVYLDHVVPGRRLLGQAGRRKRGEQAVDVQSRLGTEPELAHGPGELAGRP